MIPAPGPPLQQEGSPAVTVSVPLGQDSFCRESGIVPVQRLSHLKQLHPQVSVHLKSCGDGGVAKGQVEVTTGSPNHKPARGSARGPQVAVLRMDQRRTSAASQVTEQPF